MINPTSKRNKVGHAGNGTFRNKGKIANLHIGERIEEVSNEADGDWDLVDDDV